MRDYLVRHQKVCPVCKRPIWREDARHHWLIGQMKGRPELDEPILNVLLCHNSSCHVPPPPRLDYLCAEFVMRDLGVSPDEIEAWAESLPFKVRPDLGEAYYEARMDVCGY